MTNILTILFSVFLTAVAQLFLKVGSQKIVFPSKWSLEAIATISVSVVFNHHLILGLLCYFISAVVWIYVLAHNEVSYAYPFVGISFALVAIFGWLILDDNLTLLRIMGIAMVCVGVGLISRT